MPAATGQETKLVGQLVQGRALSLSLGLVGTLLTVTAILGSIDIAISHILGREGRRAFVRERLNSMAFVLLVLVLAVASFVVSFGVQAAGSALADSGLRGVRLLFELISPLVGLAFGFWFFYLVFRFAPRRRVAPAPAAGRRWYRQCSGRSPRSRSASSRARSASLRRTARSRSLPDY